MERGRGPLQLYYRAYLVGWGGILPQRWIRCLVAKTALHRAWLCGYMGKHHDGGVCDRDSYHYRNRERPRRLIASGQDRA